MGATPKNLVNSLKKKQEDSRSWRRKDAARTSAGIRSCSDTAERAPPVCSPWPRTSGGTRSPDLGKTGCFWLCWGSLWPSSASPWTWVSACATKVSKNTFFFLFGVMFQVGLFFTFSAYVVVPRPGDSPCAAVFRVDQLASVPHPLLGRIRSYRRTTVDRWENVFNILKLSKFFYL